MKADIAYFLYRAIGHFPFLERRHLALKAIEPVEHILRGI